MKYAALFIATFFVLMAAIPKAGAVVCARGVYRAGCAGPNGAVVAHRGVYGRPYVRGVYR